MSMLRQDTELLDDNGEKVSLKAQSLCIIMEYLSPNLEEYVLSHHTFERPVSRLFILLASQPFFLFLIKISFCDS